MSSIDILKVSIILAHRPPNFAACTVRRCFIPEVELDGYRTSVFYIVCPLVRILQISVLSTRVSPERNHESPSSLG
jgi:hypothetical protein